MVKLFCNPALLEDMLFSGGDRAGDDVVPRFLERDHEGDNDMIDLRLRVGGRLHLHIRENNLMYHEFQRHSRFRLFSSCLPAMA